MLWLHQAMRYFGFGTAPRQVEEDLDLDDLFWWKKGVLGLLGPARSSSVQLGPASASPAYVNGLV